MDAEKLNIFLSRSQKFHIIKYKGLLIELENTEKVKHFIDIELFKTIPAQTLINSATDFFWQSLHILVASLKINAESLNDDFFYFSLAFYDSFFNDIKSEFTLHFPKKKIPLTFPNIGIATDKQIRFIKKISENLIEINYYNNTELINLKKIPSTFEFKHQTLNNGIIVLNKTSKNLFEDKQNVYVCEDKKLIQKLVQKFEKAFRIIESVDYALFEKLKKNLDYIIPYGNNPNLLFPNFTTATLKRTLFLSINLINEKSIHTAECIIHEHSHCELNIIQDTELLITSEHNKLEYYSPWRKDLRPLLGLIHGIYISNDLVNFYYKIIKQEKLDGIYPIITKIIHQILIAIAEIKYTDLTAFTKGFLTDIKKNVTKKSKDLKICLHVQPVEIKDHINQWKGSPLIIGDYDK